MKVLFIDRDGTLIQEPTSGYIKSIKELKIFPNVIKSLQNLQTKGYKLIMISNQPGLGTKKFPYEKFQHPQNKLMSIFKENHIKFEGEFFCPHFKEDNCNCRKPKTGLIDNFLKKNYFDLKMSFVIGDRESDIQLAKNIGCKSIFYSNLNDSGIDFSSKDWIKIADYILENNN